MSVTIRNDKNVTWEQVESAVDNLEGFSIEKDESEDEEDRWWWMTWVVDEYERYASKLKYETQKEFRRIIEPVDGMFVVRRPFWFEDGVLYYDIPRMDDMGIFLHLLDELKVGYVSELDDYEGIREEENTTT
jgi:hypothetical protein